MDNKVPTIHGDSEHTQVPRERLAPGKLANFPGSLVANLGDNLKATSYPQNKGSLANWVVYFGDGWDDPGIWKSAVGIELQKRCQPFQTLTTIL